MTDLFSPSITGIDNPSVTGISDTVNVPDYSITGIMSGAAQFGYNHAQGIFDTVKGVGSAATTAVGTATKAANFLSNLTVSRVVVVLIGILMIGFALFALVQRSTVMEVLQNAAGK